MKLIEGFEERDRCGRSVFSHNGLSYELIPEYGNFPDEFQFSMYSGGCCDKEDNLFMICLLYTSAGRVYCHPVCQ